MLKNQDVVVVTTDDERYVTMVREDQEGDAVLVRNSKGEIESVPAGTVEYLSLELAEELLNG